MIYVIPADKVPPPRSARGCDKLIPEHAYEEVKREGAFSWHRCADCGKILRVEVVPFETGGAPTS